MTFQFEGFWIPYTNTLQNATEEQLKDIFQGILRHSKVREVYLDGIAAAGLSFEPTNETASNVGRQVSNVDVFTLFDQVRTSESRTDVKLIGWIEAWGFTFPKTPLSRFASGKKGIISPSPNFNNVVFLDPLNPDIHSVMKKALLELARRSVVDGIAVDDHFGLLNSTKLANGLTIDLRGEMLKRYQQANVVPQGPDQWLDEQITKKLKDISKAVRGEGKRFIASTNPFAWAKKETHQDAALWYQEGDLDALNIQIYRNNIEKFADELNKTKSTLENLAGSPATPVSISITTEVGGIQISNSTIKAKVDKALSTLIQGKQVTLIGFDYKKWREKLVF